jgi:hypothetical protein
MQDTPTFDLHRTDGLPVSGPLVYLEENSSIRVGKSSPDRATGVEFVSLRRAGSPLPPYPLSEHLVLANGDRLALDPKGPLRTNGDSLECRLACRVNGKETLSLPTSRVAAIWRATPKGVDSAETWLRRFTAERRRQDLVLLTDGDRMNGTVRALDRQGELLVDANGRDVKIPFGRVAAVAFNSDLLLGGTPKTRHAHLVLANGSRLTVAGATLATGASTLLAKTVLGDTLEIPLQELAALDVRLGSAVYLSDLTPREYKHTPFLGVAWPFAKDASVAGRPLFLSGSTFDKGLGMHAASRITYDLGGKYRRFEGWVGLDGHTGLRGRALVRVFVDGKRQGIGKDELSGRDRPLPVRIDLHGARELTLEVDFAGSGDVQAHVDWADARLIR